MNSRERILEAVKKNQPAWVELPMAVSGQELPDQEGRVEAFIAMLSSIGGVAHRIAGFEEVSVIVNEKFAGVGRILANFSGLPGIAETVASGDDPHLLADVGLAILRVPFGVAENGAVWVTEAAMIDRALPFICQHLAVVIDKKDIVVTMQEAYARIAGADYAFGVFIAGPSKTADIEQSLVLGAHGPVSMTVFILE